jgi:hypothetical protein
MSMKHVFIAESAKKNPQNVTLLEFYILGTFSISNSVGKTVPRCRREEDDGAWEIKETKL